MSRLVSSRLRALLGRSLEAAVVGITAGLALLVVVGVISRKAGASLVWYDEVAAILLAWLTYYGAALAALHRAHLGFPNLVRLAPRGRAARAHDPKGTRGRGVLRASCLEGAGPDLCTRGHVPRQPAVALSADRLLGHPDRGSALHRGRDCGCRRNLEAGRARMTLFWILLGLLALVLSDVPIAIALGLASVAAMAAETGLRDIPNVPLTLFDGAVKFSLIAVPLFILAGAIMNASGISRRLIALTSALIGFVRGGLAMVTIGTSLFFAEISGSAVADVAALGSVLIPSMKRSGYSKEFAAAVTSSASTLAVIIPPSIPMILYAVMAGSSVVELFVAGIVPGVLGGLLMMVVAYRTAIRRGFPADMAFAWRRVAVSFREAAWALLLPVIILGGIFSGWVTATEGAGLAVVAAAAIGGLVYRELDWSLLRKATIEGGIQTAVVMLLVSTSALLGEYLTSMQVPQQFAEQLLAFTDSRWAILALLNLFFLLVGLFLHSAAAIILVVPIVMPLVQQAGIDPVHFGLVVTLNLGIGQQTPPVASVLLTACSIAKAGIWDVSRVNVVFIGVLLFVLLLVTYLPVIPMALVELFYR